MAFIRKRGLYDTGKIAYIQVDDIRPNRDQPRRYFDKDKLLELAESIKENGIIQPLSVRKTQDGYELVAGERRLRAAKEAGLKEVPCLVLDVNSYQSAVLALCENIHRQDLDFIEEAEGIYQMINVLGMSQAEVAKKLGRSQSAVANKLRILNLPGELLFIIREKGLTERHARALLRLDNDGDRVRVLEQVINRGLNVTDTEKFIDRFLEKKTRRKRPPRVNT